MMPGRACGQKGAADAYHILVAVERRLHRVDCFIVDGDRHATLAVQRAADVRQGRGVGGDQAP